jgi:hypothetical protein
MLLPRLSRCLNLLLSSDAFKLNNLSTSSCRRSLLADTKNAMLLLSFNFRNQSKPDNNTCSGLLKYEGDFNSKHLSCKCCLYAIMKNLYQL